MNVIKSIIEVTAIAPNSIVNADCLDAMKLIPDKSIDSIICDLPYQMTACAWDKLIPFEPLWEQYKRIIKPNGAIALFGSQPFTSALVMSNPKWFKYEWIWEKNRFCGFMNAKRKPLIAHENICVFYEKQPTYNPQFRPYSASTIARYKHGEKKKKGTKIITSIYGTQCGNGGDPDYDRGAYPFSTLKINAVNGANGARLHNSQKPTEVYEYLIKTYTQEGELILDNTAGSGTLAIAAINTNRQYICIEKDEHYFEVMRNRIANHDPNAPIKTKKPKPVPKGQLTLFGDDVCA